MGSEPPDPDLPAADGAAPPAVRGRWHPPRSSLAVSARLDAADGAFAVVGEDGARLTAGAPAEVAISDRVGRIPRRLTFADGSVFETGDNDAVDRLVAGLRGAAGARVAGWVHRLEAFHPRLVALAALVVVFLLAIYHYALPAMVEVAVLVTPPVVPELLSEGALSSMDQLVLDPSRLSEDEQASIRADFAALAAASSVGSDRLRLEFRDGGGLGPNAFALPDGTVVLTDALVRFAGGDRDLVLGVLGHEIGHVAGQHSLRQLYRAAGISGLVMVIGGDVGGGVEDLLVQGGGLLSLAYSRDHERAADRYGVALMRTAGRDPAGLARFFERLEAEHRGGDGPAFLSTHPGTPERRREILQQAGEAAAGP